MSDLTSGRTEPCKDNLGGLWKIYLMDYVEYGVPLMVGYKTHQLTSFPTTYIYGFEGRGKTADESFRDMAYEQIIRMTLSKQDAATQQLMELLTGKRIRAITTDHKGVNRIYGLKNGMDVEVSIISGNGKSDFNGYELTIKGIEEYKAHFVGNLNDVGFFESTPTFGALLASSSKASSLHYKVAATNIPQ